MDAAGFDLAVPLARLTEVGYRMLAALPLLLLALLWVALSWQFGRWLSRRALLDRVGHRNAFLRDLARTTVQALTVAVGVLVALEILDATALVGAVLGTAGVLGVALGFAFKETLENYLAGILMSLRQPFSPRDHLVIDGHEGVVIAMTSRANILMTPDGNHLRISNALVFRSVTLNYTRNPSRRFEFDVAMGVGENLVQAQQIGTAQLRGLDEVLQDPPARAYISALGDTTVQVRFHGWVDQRSHDFLMVKSEAMRSVKLALERAAMDLPEPIDRSPLTGHGDGVAAPVESAPVFSRPSPRVAGWVAGKESAVDTGINTDLQQQILHDPRAGGSANLLDPAAPQEWAMPPEPIRRPARPRAAGVTG